MRALIIVAAGLVLAPPETVAQDGGMSWIDAARNAPAVSATVVPAPDRRPKPPAASRILASAGASAPPPPVRADRKPEDGGAIAAARGEVETAITAPEVTGSTPKADPAKEAPAAPPPARKPAREKAAAVPVPPRAGSSKRQQPVETAQKRRQAPQSSDQARKCQALGRCRDAFAKCKAQFVKENGGWDLEKEPCGDRYKVCIRKTFAPGEMFFTRWFWPYEECP